MDYSRVSALWYPHGMEIYSREGNGQTSETREILGAV